MRASDFVAAHASHGLAVWEREALDLIRKGEIAETFTSPVPVQTRDGTRRGTFFVANDYLQIGEPGDFMRMPLTPESAQAVVDHYAVLLPTSKMVDAIWWAANTKIAPRPMIPNRYVSLPQFLEHSRIVDRQLQEAATPGLIYGGTPGLIAGHKKDVVITPRIPVGKVVIYGWHRKDGSHIQSRSSVHSTRYLDYSHGVRLVSPNMDVDGQNMSVADVLRDPVLSSMLSDQGPVLSPRYPGVAPRPGPFNAQALAPVVPPRVTAYARGTEMAEWMGNELFSWSRSILA